MTNPENVERKVQCSGLAGKEKVVLLVEGCLRCVGMKAMKVQTNVDQVQCVQCGTAWSAGRDGAKLVLTVME